MSWLFKTSLSLSLLVTVTVSFCRFFCDVTAQGQLTSGWFLQKPDWRSSSYCPCEVVLLLVTCCPLPPCYLSLPDSSFLFLSRPLLFHLPTFSSPPPEFGTAPLILWPIQATTAKACCADPFPSPLSGSYDILLQGPPNDGGWATGLWVKVHNVWVALTDWQGSSLWSTRGVITSLSWTWNWTSCPLESQWTSWDAAPSFIRRAAYGGRVMRTDTVKALLCLVINWFASQLGGGREWHSEDMYGDEEVTNTAQHSRDFIDKNILSWGYSTY